MTSIADALRTALQQTITTFTHTWPYLLIGIVVAAAFAVYADRDAVSGFLRRHRRGSVLVATLVAVLTPLCSCGTMAVILGMLATSVPWAPIVAFMVASPLTSPEELVYSAGLFGWPFALALFAASIALGLLGGAAAHTLEARGLLRNQLRFRLADGPAEPAAIAKRPTLASFGVEVGRNARRLLLLFFVFAFLGYFVNALVPSAWVRTAFGNGAHWGVPLAATLGVPFYVNTEASLPMVRAFLDNGASAGAALAFLITGAGTSLGAIAGALSIARWRIVSLVVATLWVGAVVSGVAYDMATPASVRMKSIAKVEPTTAIEQDLRFLTDAQAAGRLAGSEGARRAARYLAAALRDAGFEPAGSEGYLQPVEVPGARLTAPSRFRVGERTLTYRVDYTHVAALSSRGRARGRLTVVETDGLVDAGSLPGRVVLIRDQSEDLDLEATAELAARHGAVALLADAGDVSRFHKSAFAGSGPIPVLAVRHPIARELAQAGEVEAELDLPIDTASRPCRNVLGVLRSPGARSTLLLAAHYDHVGDDPGGARYPGAFDNASGVATVLAAARALASGARLPYNVLVALLTGEKSGLWGARTLQRSPPLPFDAAITVDGVGIGGAPLALRVGHNDPGDPLAEIGVQAMAGQGIEPVWVSGHDDSIVFIDAGMPTLGLGQQPSGKQVLPLHSPDDRLEVLDLPTVARVAELVVTIARGLPAEFPRVLGSGSVPEPATTAALSINVRHTATKGDRP